MSAIPNPSHRAVLVAALVRDPALLALSVTLLVRDCMQHHRVSRAHARKAIAEAKKQVSA